MNTLLQAMSFGDRAAYAGKMVLIGMLVVVSSLATLWLALALFRRFLERGSGAGETPAPPAPAPVPKAAPAPVPVAQKQDDAIIAAITAAVAAALAAENGGVTPAFRVVSYRRIGK